MHWKIFLGICLVLAIAQSGCSGVQQTHQDRSPGQPTSEQVAASSQAPADLSQSPQVPNSPQPGGDVLAELKQAVRVSGHTETATLTVTATSLNVALSTGADWSTKNPFGKDVKARLEVIPLDSEDHLLVVAAIERPVMGWVLVPRSGTLSVGLNVVSDYDIVVEGSSVKVSSRDYSGSGLGTKSRFYRYSSKTGAYELDP